MAKSASERNARFEFFLTFHNEDKFKSFLLPHARTDEIEISFGGFNFFPFRENEQPIKAIQSRNGKSLFTEKGDLGKLIRAKILQDDDLK